ncbi:MAG: MATE family efflux transporter [Cyanobacteria bacterium J06631_12]
MTIAVYLTGSLRSELREFFKLAVPLAGAQVAQSATGFADTIMMGRMGSESLAAGGLAAIIFLAVMTTVTGTVMGVSPLVAEAFGAGHTRRIQRLVRQGLWLSLLVSIPLMIGMGYSGDILLSTGQDAQVAKLASSYLNTVLWSLLPVTAFAVLRSAVSALSVARPVMVIIGIGTAFNIAGNYALGFGKWGLPELGLQGLALATVLAWWGMFFGLAAYVVWHPSLRPYAFFQSLHRLRPRTLMQLAWVGVPIGLFSGLESGFFMVITLWMGWLGTAALAAHQLVLQTIIVAFMVPLGISFATTVRVGQWLGRRHRQGIVQATGVSVSVTLVLMVGISALFLYLPRQVIGLYLDVNRPENREIVAIATPLLTIAAIAQVLDGIQKAVYGALQGLQDTRVPMILNILGYWGIGLSSSYLFVFVFGMGPVGLWLGQSAAIVSVTVLFVWRLFYHFHNLRGAFKPLQPDSRQYDEPCKCCG